jgi:hypothetical protein
MKTTLATVLALGTLGLLASVVAVVLYSQISGPPQSPPGRADGVASAVSDEAERPGHLDNIKMTQAGDGQQ